MEYMEIYFDTCCYNRPYDDQMQSKVRMESEAVKNIVKLAQWYGYTIFGSKTLEIEIGRISDLRKYNDVLGFYRRTVTDRAYLKKNVFEQIAPTLKRMFLSRSRQWRCRREYVVWTYFTYVFQYRLRRIIW